MAILRANNNTLSSVTALPFATGGLVKISTTTASGDSSVDFTGLDTTSTYSMYLLVVDNMTADSDNAALLYLRFFTGGTIYTGSNYNNVTIQGWSSIASLGQASTTLGSQAKVISYASSGYYMPGSTYEHVAGTLQLFRMNDANHPAIVNYQFGLPVSGQIHSNQSGTMTLRAGASVGDCDGLRIFLSSGNISGTFTLYGVTA